MGADPLHAAMDEEGYLIEPNEWTEEIALELARHEQVAGMKHPRAWSTD